MKRGSRLLLLATSIFAAACTEVGEPESEPDILDELWDGSDDIPYSGDCPTVERQHERSGGCHDFHMYEGDYGACISYICCGTPSDGVSLYVYCLSPDAYTCASAYFSTGDSDFPQCGGTELN